MSLLTNSPEDIENSPEARAQAASHPESASQPEEARPKYEPVPDPYLPRLRAALEVASADSIDADRVARGLSIARDLGLPQSVVMADLKYAHYENVARKIEANPALSAWAAKNEFNAAVAAGNVETLGKLFDSLQKEHEAWQSVRPDLGLGSRFLKLLGEGTQEVAKGIDGFLIGMARELGAEQPIWDEEGNATQTVAQPALNQWADKRAQALEQTEQERGPRLQAQTALGGYLQDVVRMAPQLLGQAAATLAGGPLGGMAFMGAQIAGGQYLDLKEQGIEQGRAFTAGLANAVMQAPLEQLGFGRLAGIFKTTGLKNIARRTAEGVLTEGATEFLQSWPEAATDIWARLGKDEGANEWFSRFMDALPETTKQGLYEAAVAAPWGFLGGIGKASYDRAREKAAAAFVQSQTALHENVEAVLASVKSPEIVESALEAGGQNQVVGVDARELMSLHQDGKDLLTPLGLSAEDVATASQAGQDVHLPLSRLHSRLNQDEFAAVMPFVRQLPEALNSAEAARIDEKIAADALKAAELHRENAALYEEMTAEKTRLREELSAEIRRSPGLVAQAESLAGGLDAYVDNWLKLVERFAWRMGASGQNPVELLRKITLDNVRASRRAQMSPEEIIDDDLRELNGAAEQVAVNRLTGNATQILGAGLSNSARYEVWELEDLIPSHDPENGFARNEKYPAQAQERPYHSDQGEQEKVRANALGYEPGFTVNTDPTAGNGPSIITKDGIVLGGNSRAMSLQLVYAQKPEKAAQYREALKEKAAQFGLDPASLDAMRRPVLVRVVENDLSLDEMAVKSRLYNQTTTQKLQAKAEGVSRGRLLSPETVSLLAAEMAEFDSLRQFLDSSRSKAFVQALVQDGVIERTELSSLTDKAGRLNESGKSLAENALRGLVLPDYDILADTPPAILNKLDRAIPALARLKTRGEGWDLTNVLTPALRLVAQSAKENRKLEGWLGQVDLLDQDTDKKRPAVQALALTFANATQKEVLARFEAFAKASERQQKNVGLLVAEPEGAKPAPAFVKAFLQPLVVVDDSQITDFDPLNNPRHAALLWAYENSGKSRTIAAAQAALEKIMVNKKTSADRKAEARETLSQLAEYSGGIAVHEPKLGPFFHYRKGEKLFHDQKNSLGVPLSRVTKIEGNVSPEDVEAALMELAGQDLPNEIEGITAKVNSNQRGKLNSKKASEKSTANGFASHEHQGLAAQIASAWKWAADTGLSGDKNKMPDVNVRRFVSALNVNGKEAFAWITVKETVQKEKGQERKVLRIYSAELMGAKKVREALGEEKKLRSIKGNGIAKATTTTRPRSFNEIIERLSAPVKGHIDPRIFYQPAWHGSPHKFDKFSTDYIGTGEGAQVHGWGLYFAGKKEVSEEYRKNLSEPVQILSVNGEKYSWTEKEGGCLWKDNSGAYLPDHEQEYMTRLLLKAKTGETDQSFVDAMRGWITGDTFTQDQKDILKKHLADYLDAEIRIEQPGQIFKVDIPENDVLLDEQKTLSEQPEKVKEAIGNFLMTELDKEYEGKTSYFIVESCAPTEEDAEQFNKDSLEADDKTEWLNMARDFIFANATGRNLYGLMIKIYGSDRAASLALNEMGVQGITYDGRTDGRCFVVFDDKAVKVLETFYQRKRPVEVDSKVLGVPEGSDIQEYIKAAKKFHDQIREESKLGKPVIQPDLDKPVRFSRKGWEKNKFAGARPEKWALFPYLRNIIETSTVVHSEKAVGKKGFSKVHFAVKNIVIDGKEQTAGFTLLEDSKGNLFYNIADDINSINSIKMQQAPQGGAAEQTLGHEELHQDENSPRENKISPDTDGVNLHILYSSQNEEAAYRGSTTIYPESYLINLFGSANLSTLLHETGHVFFEEMERMVESGAADESLRQDYAILRDWLGATSGEPLTVEQREKAARGFEAYLMEGKAPAVDLESAFARFKRWLLKIYQSAVALDAPLTDEVLGVFGRMISTEREMAQAAARNELLDLTARELDALGLTGQQRESAASLMTRGREAAAEALERARAENRKARLEKYHKEALEEVREMQVYKARRALRATPLDLEAVREGFGEEVAKKLQKAVPGSLKSESGIDPEIFAAEQGYESAAAMFADVLGAKSQRSKVAELREEKEARHDEAFDALEQLLETREVAIQMELVGRKLSELLGVQGIESEAYRLAAQQELQAMPLGRAVQTGVFLAAMRRALQQMRQGLLQGDREAALVAQRKAALNMEFARQSRALAKSRESLANAMKRFVAMRKGNPDARYIVMNIGARFGLLRENQQLAEGRNASTIKDWLTQVAAEGYEIFPDEATLYGEGKPWRSMSVAEFESLAETVGQIVVVERNQRKLLTTQGMASLDEVGILIATNLYAHFKKHPEKTVESQPAAVRALKSLHAIHTKIEALCLAIDGDQMGVAYDFIYKRVSDAEDRQAVRLRGVKEDLASPALFGAYSRKELAEMGTKKELVPEIGERLTRAERMALALNMGNAVNIERIKSGHGWSDAQIAAILKPLTARDWRFVQAVWDYLGTFKEEAFQLEEECNGLRPKEVEAKALTVQTADGETLQLAGGYYPIRYNPEKGDRAFAMNQKEMDKELMGGRNYGSAMTRHGHLKARESAGLGTPLLLELSVITDHVFNVVHDLCYRKAVLDVAKVINHPKVREAFESTVGPEMYRQLKPWLQDAANQTQEPMHQIHRWARWARASASIMQMGYKITTLLMQPIGITQSMELLGYGWTARGIRRVYGNLFRLPELLQETYARSPFMQTRVQGFDREVHDITRRLKPGLGRFGWLQVVKDKAFVPMGIIQMGVDLPTWWGAYEKGLKDFSGDEAKAAQYADSIVRMSQGSGAAKDLSRVQRGNELMRLATMFYSYFNTLYQLGARRIAWLKQHHSPADIFTAANTALLLWFVPAILSELVVGHGPDDDDDKWKWASRLIAQYPFQTVVGVRDIASGVFGSYGYQITPAQSAPASLVKWFASVNKALEKEDPALLAKPTAEAVGYAFSLPLKQPIITVGNLWNYLTGKDPDFAVRDLFFVKKKEKK